MIVSTESNNLPIKCMMFCNIPAKHVKAYDLYLLQNFPGDYPIGAKMPKGAKITLQVNPPTNRKAYENRCSGSGDQYSGVEYTTRPELSTQT